MSGVAGEGCEILVPFNERRPLAEIERSLVKTYRKQVWSKFIKAIKDYKLVEEGDKISYCYFRRKRFFNNGKAFSRVKKTWSNKL
ncbi:hypothetical protein [Clostridium perfringens str. 13]|uniref:Uncharacterized protein n=1 Tax=Clostridium perfringens (strain 13 / Type A) TaxID=195102 RepID=Q8XKA5_CLOPE|nr:hypothetical protein [Clostridium perfringens str. 13]